MIRPRTLAFAPLVTVVSVAAALFGAALLIPTTPVVRTVACPKAPPPARLTVAEVPKFFEGEFRWDGDQAVQTAALDVLNVAEAGGLIVATGRGTYTTTSRSVDFTFRIEANPQTGEFTMWESEPSVAAGFVTEGRHEARFNDSLDGVTARWIGDDGQNGTLTLRARAHSARVDGHTPPRSLFPHPTARVLDNGVQLQLLHDSTTPNARCVEADSDRVTVHYMGWNARGVVDSTWDRGKPATFSPDRVIKGWSVALHELCEGDFARVWIPADAGYGHQHHQAPGDLVFDIELIAVNR